MPALKNVATGQPEIVEDSQAAAAIAAGTHVIDPELGPVHIRAVSGQVGITSPEQLAALRQASGAVPPTVAPSSDVAAQEEAAYEEARYSGPGETLAAGLTGAGDFFSLGGLSAIERATDPANELARNTRQHRGAYMAGQVVGAVATANPAAIAATPAGMVMRGARAIGTPGAAVGKLGSAAIKGAGMAVEGAGLGAGMGLAEAAIAEDDFTLEHIVGSIKTNALLGGAGGGALAAGGGLITAGWRGARKIADAMGKRASAQAVIPEELSGLDFAGLRARREVEVETLKAAAVPERAALADEITKWRAAGKEQKHWIAVEGFKGKKPGKPGKAKAPTYDQLGGKPVTKTVPLAEIEDRLISIPGEIEGRTESIRRGLAEGKKLPPVSVSVLPDGQLFVNDGRHRLREYMARGDKKVRVRFERGSAGADAGTEPLKPRVAAGDDVIEAGGKTMRMETRAETVGTKERFHVELKGQLGDGEEVVFGKAEFRVRDGELYPHNVDVVESMRRQGLATKMYERAEAMTGKRISASRTQTPEGKALSESFAARRAAKPTASATLDVPPELAREFRDIGKLTFEADKKLDRLLRNPKRLAAKPWLAEDALQQSEAALERLQAVAPELKQRMAADLGSSGQREAALDQLDAFVERNRQLQAKVSALTPESLGGKWKPSSAMLEAIDTAEDALKSTPKTSLLQEAATGFAMGAMAGVVPGGPLAAAAAYVAPRVARRLTDLVFGRIRRAAITSGARTERAVAAFTDVGRRGRPAALPTATAILGGAKLDPPTPPPRGQRAPKPDTSKKVSPLANAYRARADELRQYVALAPDGMLRVSPAGRQAIARELAGVAAVAPLLADKLETLFARRLEFLAGKLPRRPDLGMQIGPDNYIPSTMEMRSLARFWEAADNPSGVEDRLADGTISPEDAEAYRNLYPERLADLTRQVVERLPELRQTLPQQRQLALSILTGVPVHPALEPSILRILQEQHTMEEGTEGGTTAPQAQPQFGSVTAEQPTRAQQRMG